MTTAVRTYLSGSVTVTEYSIHPPGFSFNPVDVGTEVVTKMNASEGMLKGQIVEMPQLTAGGEVWRLQLASSGSMYTSNFRIGIVSADSASGTATVTISRFQRTALPTSTIRKLVCKYGNGSNIGGGPGQIYQPLIPKIITVAKPSAETWSLGGPIYFYVLAGVTAYTSIFATASASDKYGFAGVNSVNRDSGETIGTINAYYASFGPERSGRRALPESALSRFQSATVFVVGTSVYSDEAMTSFGGLDAVLRPVLRGILTIADFTTTPKTYYYYQGPSNDCNDLNTVRLLYTDEGCNVWSATGAMNTIFSRYTSETTRIDILASGLYGSTPSVSATPGPISSPRDMALDVDLPAPIGNARIVWSPALIFFAPNPVISPYILSPSVVRRTTTSAPETGMVATSSMRTAQYCASRGVNDTPGLMQFDVSFRRLPYQVNERSVSALASSRVAILPDSISVTGGAGAAATWGWSRFDRGLNAWTVLSSGNAMSYAASRWTASAIGYPPGFVATDAALFRIDMAGASGLSFPFDLYTGALDNRLEIWPHDVPMTNAPGMPTYSDCRWVGSKGWAYPDAFVIPTVTWGTPSASWLAGVMTLDMGTIPTYATSPSLGLSQLSGNLWQNPRFRFISGEYISDYSASPSAIWINKKSGLNISLAQTNAISTTNPRGNAGPATVTVNCWQVHLIDSDYGPVGFIREVPSMTVVIP